MEPSAGELELLSAIASRLAVAVQNARLHEEATRLGAELEQALASERAAARRLGALYEISRSFAQSLSLDVTLEAVVRTVVELLEVDAAVLRMPDPAARAAAAARAARRGGASARARALDALPSAGVRRRAHPASLPQRRADRARRCDGARARRVARAARAVPREGLDRRDGPDRDDRRGARLADAALGASRPPGRRVDDRVRRRDRRPGRARDRQRAPLPAAEGLLGRDAALAAAAGSRRRSQGLDVGDGVRGVGARRRRRRPLRLHGARRTAGSRSCSAT